jgi:Endonuclease/Exonuclease/phosphatase family.
MENLRDSLFTLGTWNVLHRYHEENYVPKSLILKNYPDEKKRINDQISLIDEILKTSKSILCLQEVSGDLLENIKNKFANYNILTYEHKRIPTLKKQSLNIYKDAREFMIILANKEFEIKENSYIQLKMLGKAIQAVTFLINDKTFTVQNVHHSFKRTGEVEILENFTTLKDKKIKNPILICGDFNRKYHYLKKSLITNNLYSMVDEFVNTDIYPFTMPEKKISYDHILGLNFKENEFILSKIINVDTSDHNMVITRIINK